MIAVAVLGYYFYRRQQLQKLSNQTPLRSLKDQDFDPSPEKFYDMTEYKETDYNTYNTYNNTPQPQTQMYGNNNIASSSSAAAAAAAATTEMNPANSFYSRTSPTYYDLQNPSTPTTNAPQQQLQQPFYSQNRIPDQQQRQEQQLFGVPYNPPPSPYAQQQEQQQQQVYGVPNAQDPIRTPDLPQLLASPTAEVGPGPSSSSEGAVNTGLPVNEAMTAVFDYVPNLSDEIYLCTYILSPNNYYFFCQVYLFLFLQQRAILFYFHAGSMMDGDTARISLRIWKGLSHCHVWVLPLSL
jgi:hypothetical protein